MAKTREPKPANTKDAARFIPRPCRACKALSKKKCMFCGQSWNMAKQDMTDWEILIYDAHVEKIAWLQKLYDQLVNLKQKKLNVLPENDGKLSGLEGQIIAWIGDWRN
jgi:hypothetical protein